MLGTIVTGLVFGGSAVAALAIMKRDHGEAYRARKRAAKLLNHSEQYIRKLVAMGELDGSERGIVVRSIAGYLERIAARGGQTKRLRADRGDCPYYVSAK